MRTGEACALSWDNIDLDERIITIEKNVYCKRKDEKGRWYVGTPKTSNSNRQVYINDTLLTALTNYKIKQNCLKKKYGRDYHHYHLDDILNNYGKVIERRIVETIRNSKKYNSLDLVFTKKNEIYNGTDLIKYPYKVIHNKLDINNCRFYDLRGSFATGSLRLGVEIKDIADTLGHSKVETTENYYISSTDDSRKEANEIFEKTVQSKIIYEISKYEND